MRRRWFPIHPVEETFFDAAPFRLRAAFDIPRPAAQVWAGVFVIDAKDIRGKVRIARSPFRAEKLLISGCNRTKLIDGLDRQVAVVRAMLDDNGYADVPVQGVLCFTKADLPLLGTLKMRGHLLLRCKALAKRLNAEGPLQSSAIDALARTLVEALPPA